MNYEPNTINWQIGDLVIIPQTCKACDKAAKNAEAKQ